MRYVELVTGWCGLCATVLAVTYGCSGNHDRLKKDDPVGGEGGVGGMGGEGGVSTGATGGQGGIEEPEGPPQLTIVNGTVDEDAIRWCFVPYPSGPSGESPWPSSSRQDYARGDVVAIADVVPSGTDVEVVLIAGSFAATDGDSCADLIDATPAGVVAHSVGVLPESVFTTETSILLVSAGCIGGRNHEHENEEQICGSGYAVDQPTATLVAGFMSRLTDSSKLPMQFVQASTSLGDVQLRVSPGNGTTPQAVLSQWSFGAIAPYPPYMSLGVDQLGSIGQTSVQLYIPGSQSPLVSLPWATALANSDLEEADVQNGRGLAFIGVGPQATFAAGAWWNGYELTVVSADPD